MDGFSSSSGLLSPANSVDLDMPSLSSPIAFRSRLSTRRPRSGGDPPAGISKPRTPSRSLFARSWAAAASAVRRKLSDSVHSDDDDHLHPSALTPKHADVHYLSPQPSPSPALAPAPADQIRTHAYHDSATSPFFEHDYRQDHPNGSADLSGGSSPKRSSDGHHHSDRSLVVPTTSVDPLIPTTPRIYIDAVQDHELESDHDNEPEPFLPPRHRRIPSTTESIGCQSVSDEIADLDPAQSSVVAFRDPDAVDRIVPLPVRDGTATPASSIVMDAISRVMPTIPSIPTTLRNAYTFTGLRVAPRDDAPVDDDDNRGAIITIPKTLHRSESSPASLNGAVSSTGPSGDDSPDSTPDSVNWPLAAQSLRLLGSSVSECRITADPNSALTPASYPDPESDRFARELYIRSLGYLLRAMPESISETEYQFLSDNLSEHHRARFSASAVPSYSRSGPSSWLGRGGFMLTSVNSNSTDLVTTNSPGSPASPPQISFLQNITAVVTLQLVQMLCLVLPFARLMLARMYQYERSHHMTERIVAIVLFALDHFLAAMVRVGALNDGKVGQAAGAGAVWVVRSVLGGVNEGLVRSWSTYQQQQFQLQEHQQHQQSCQCDHGHDAAVPPPQQQKPPSDRPFTVHQLAASTPDLAHPPFSTSSSPPSFAPTPTLPPPQLPSLASLMSFSSFAAGAFPRFADASRSASSPGRDSPLGNAAGAGGFGMGVSSSASMAPDAHLRSRPQRW